MEVIEMKLDYWSELMRWTRSKQVHGMSDVEGGEKMSIDLKSQNSAYSISTYISR